MSFFARRFAERCLHFLHVGSNPRPLPFMQMSDYNILAFSSQRSGRHGMEGLAHYSAGVTMDSIGQYGKALESYKKFLAVCT